MSETNTKISLQCIDICVDNNEIIGRLFGSDGFYGEAYITKQLREIYGKVEMKPDFLKRLECKINLTIMKRKRDGKSTEIELSTKDNDYVLITPLNEIYEPVTLTYDGVKIGGKPYLLFDAHAHEIIYERGRSFLKCSPSSDGGKCLIDFDRLNITKDIDRIYNDKTVKKSFKKLLGLKKISTKKQFAESLTLFFKDKILQVEYDEHYGITLWSCFESFID